MFTNFHFVFLLNDISLEEEQLFIPWPTDSESHLNIVWTKYLLGLQLGSGLSFLLSAPTLSTSTSPSSVLLVPIYPLITLSLACLDPTHLLPSLMVHVLCWKKTPKPSFALMCPHHLTTCFQHPSPLSELVHCFSTWAALIHLCLAGIMETHLQATISTPHLRKLQWLKSSFPQRLFSPVVSQSMNQSHIIFLPNSFRVRYILSARK